LKKWKILDNLEPKEGGAKTEMIRFLLGVIVGVLILLLFIYFGGGKTVKKVGEGLTETGKSIKKRILKEEKEAPKKGQ
jgi:hypothetical protein